MAGLGVALLGLAILSRWDPAVAAFYPRCPSLLLTGTYCPGCGSLRGIHRLLHGNLAGAFSMNPWMHLALPLAVAMVVHPPLSRNVWLARSLFWVTLGFWILRNLPWWPFSLLAPH